jgi:hypothetical protein
MKEATVTMVIATAVLFPTMEDGMGLPLIPIPARMRDTRTRRNPTLRLAPPSSTDAGEAIGLIFLHRLTL